MINIGMTIKIIIDKKKKRDILHIILNMINLIQDMKKEALVEIVIKDTKVEVKKNIVIIEIVEVGVGAEEVETIINQDQKINMIMIIIINILIKIIAEIEIEKKNIRIILADIPKIKNQKRKREIIKKKDVV
jgi:hypothetical protein